MVFLALLLGRAFVKQLAVSVKPTSTIPGGERLLIPHRHQRALAGSEEGGEETAVIQSRPPSQNKIKCRSAQPCLTSSSVYYRMTAITQRCGWKSATYKHKGCHTERGVCCFFFFVACMNRHTHTLTQQPFTLDLHPVNFFYSNTNIQTSRWGKQ